MLRLYYRKSCKSSYQALLWLKNHGIPFQVLSMSSVNHEVLVQALTFTEKGMDEILKRRDHKNLQRLSKLNYLQHLTFNEGVDYLVKHPDLLKAPLLLEDNKCLVGYNVEEIRQFLPRTYRQK